MDKSKSTQPSLHFDNSRSEDAFGKTWDRCITDLLVKMGGGLGLGVVFSLVLFGRRPWPLFFGVGSGFGMAYNNCQAAFNEPFSSRYVPSPFAPQIIPEASKSALLSMSQKKKGGNDDCTKIEPCQHKSEKPCNQEQESTCDGDCRKIPPCSKKEDDTCSSSKPCGNEDCASKKPCGNDDCASIKPCGNDDSASKKPCGNDDCASIKPCAKNDSSSKKPCAKDDCTPISPCVKEQDCTPIPPCVKELDCTPIPPCIKEQDCTPIPPCTKEQDCTSISPCTKEQDCTSISPCTKEQECTSVSPCTKQQDCSSISACIGECTSAPPSDSCKKEECSSSYNAGNAGSRCMSKPPCITEAQCIGKSPVKEEKISTPRPLVIREVTCTPMAPIQTDNKFHSNVSEGGDRLFQVQEEGVCTFLSPCVKDEKNKSESHRHHHHHHHHHGDSKKEHASKNDLIKEHSSKSDSKKEFSSKAEIGGNLSEICKDQSQMKSEDTNQKSKYVPVLVQKLKPVLKKELDNLRELKNSGFQKVTGSAKPVEELKRERIENLKKRGINLSDPSVRKRLNAEARAQMLEMKKRSRGDKSNLESSSVKEDPCNK